MLLTEAELKKKDDQATKQMTEAEKKLKKF
jgi:hypothetical protein